MFWFIVAQIFSFVLDVVVLRGQSHREKDLEILLLRQQLRIVERKQVQRRGLSRWEKLSLAVLLAGFKTVSRGSAERLREVMRLFQPETVLKWHRELVRRKWTYVHTPPSHVARFCRKNGNDRIKSDLRLRIRRGGYDYRTPNHFQRATFSGRNHRAVCALVLAL